MKEKLAHEEYVAMLKEINPDVEVVDTYVNSATPLTFRCQVCGHEWKVPAYNLLRGTKCPACQRQKRTKGKERFIREMTEINPNIDILGKYVNNKTKVHCRCKICGYEWKPVPSSLLRGHGCPKCAGNAPKRERR